LTVPNPLLTSTGFFFGYLLICATVFRLKEVTMKQRSLSLVSVFFLSMVMVVGTVCALSAGAASPQSTPTTVAMPDQRDAVPDQRDAVADQRDAVPDQRDAVPDQRDAVPDQRDAVRDAVHWLIGNHQNDDGGYTSFSSGANQAPSNVAGTMDAIASE
jgi:hypothetical protein